MVHTFPLKLPNLGQILGTDLFTLSKTSSTPVIETAEMNFY